MKTATTSKSRPTAREIALRALYQIEHDGAFAEESVESFSSPSGLSPADRRLMAELVFGTTKMRKRIDFLLDYLVEDGLEKLTPWIRNLLRMGIYQLEF